MSGELSGPEPDDTAAPADPGLAERLIREEFSEAAPAAHRNWFRRESALAAGHDELDESIRVGAHETAEVPVVGTAWSGDQTIVGGAAVIHEEFAPMARAPRSRSHRAGMLAGLGVVGALLAVLVVLAPGGSKPRLPEQSVHDVSPIAASGPRTAAATTPSTAAPSTTSSSAPAASPTTQPHQNETISTFVTYSYVPGTPAATPTQTTPAPTVTTVPPQTTTTTTSSPQTTTTTAPKHCLLGLIC